MTEDSGLIAAYILDGLRRYLAPQRDPWAFLVVCVLLAGIAVLQVILFRRMRWL